MLTTNEISKKLSTSAAVLAACLSSTSMSGPLSDNFILPPEYQIHQNKKTDLTAKKAITEMTEVIKLQVAAVFILDKIHKDLENNELDTLTTVLSDQHLIDLVNILPKEVKDFRKMLDMKSLNTDEATLLDMIIAGHINIRNRAKRVLKLAKQMTFIPRVFDSQLTDHDLSEIAEKARQVSNSYS